MKTTPLTTKHTELGAKMVDFAGYNMPVSYSGIKEEHQAVRNCVGVFDVSHMGEFIVRGKRALDFLQYVTSNDVSKLAIGQAQYSCFPNGQGGIVDDLLVYRLPEDRCSAEERAYMLVVNASNIEKDWNWLQQHNNFDVKLIDISEQTALLAVQGPQAATVLATLTDLDLGAMKYYTFEKGQIAGCDNVLISATGYTGAGGFELYINNQDVLKVWDAIFDTSTTTGIEVLPIGLGARDTLRLEMGYSLYGNDIDDTTSPIEAGLGWITKVKKGQFIDQPLFAEQKKTGVTRKLVAFQVEGRRVPRHDYIIEDEAGTTIGKVTSGTLSPSLGYPIGLGYVPTAFAQAGQALYIVAGKKRLSAHVVKLPFYTS
ncbi:MAG: glycine cleavage system aminomethyltransferase GcvT [Bacteroidota bacterium]